MCVQVEHETPAARQRWLASLVQLARAAMHAPVSPMMMYLKRYAYDMVASGAVPWHVL